MAVATLNIRDIDSAAAARIKQAAHARGWTMGKYLAALSALHDAARQLADNGDRKIADALDALGLETQRV